MPPRGEVLVAIVPTRRDLEIARKQHWYRIPVAHVAKRLKGRWPPQWLAFYQPKVFGDEAFGINYFAQVQEIREVLRTQLFPDEPRHKHADWLYYQLMLGQLHKLPEPIRSRRMRRIVFIPTTWHKLVSASEINDLFDDGELEERLWSEFRRLGIGAERHEYVRLGSRNHVLDFALYCMQGRLGIETGADALDAGPAPIPLEDARDDPETGRWDLLRFNSYQINEQMEEYTLPTILKNITERGGLEDGLVLPPGVDEDPDILWRMGLFGDPEE